MLVQHTLGYGDVSSVLEKHQNLQMILEGWRQQNCWDQDLHSLQGRLVWIDGGV